MRSGADNSTYQGANQHGVHDSSCTLTGSGITKDRGAGTEDDRYEPWMLVTRRKLRQKRTNTSVISRNHSSHELGQTVHGLRQEPNGEIRG